MALCVLHYADIEAAHDDPERIGRLAGLIDELRDGETLVCGGGDNTGPGVLSVVTEGRQSLEFFRTVEPDAETLGNHDFDHGVDALLSVVADAPQPWLCANATPTSPTAVLSASTTVHGSTQTGPLLDSSASHTPRPPRSTRTPRRSRSRTRFQRCVTVSQRSGTGTSTTLSSSRTVATTPPSPGWSTRI